MSYDNLSSVFVTIKTTRATVLKQTHYHGREQTKLYLLIFLRLCTENQQIIPIVWSFLIVSLTDDRTDDLKGTRDEHAKPLQSQGDLNCPWCKKNCDFIFPVVVCGHLGLHCK